MDSLPLAASVAIQAAEEYAVLAWYQLFAKDYVRAEHNARYGLSLDPRQTWINTYLAHALLFQNKDMSAQTIYEAFKNQTAVTGTSYKDQLKADFDTLEEKGLDKKQLDKARKWISD